jgi:hypothetical protein
VTAAGAFRLAWRLQRAEMLFVAALCLGLAAAAAWLALDMRSISAACEPGGPAEAPCGVIYAFQTTHGQAVMMIQMVTSLVPFGTGLVLGVPIVARDVEHRTALIAWPLSGSRLRWLAWRAVPVLLIAIALVSILAVAADQMTRAFTPNSAVGFANYEARGLPLVMRTAVMLMVGVMVGALIGRMLPALLVGIGLSVIVSAGLGAALPNWVPSAELTGGELVVFGPGPLRTGVEYRLASGEIVSAQEGEILMQSLYEESGGEEPDPAEMPEQIMYGISADRYPDVLLRESLAITAAALAVGAIAVMIVRRRRPE